MLELFHRTPLPATAEWLDFLDTLARQAAIAIDNVELFNDLQRSTLELGLAYDSTIEGWSRAMDLRDRETEGHTQRVTEMTVMLARALGVSDKDLVHVRRGALLHDVGKVGVPAGLAGMGDLIATCASPHSRNHQVGERLARGESIATIRGTMKMVAEGVPTAKAALQLAQPLGIELPITEQVYAVTFENKEPRQAVMDLMTRAAKAELG